MLSELKERIRALTRPSSPAADMEAEARRQNYPRADEVGIVHPDNHSGILVRDTGTVDIFAVPHLGLRLDPNTQSLSIFSTKVQEIGDQWAGIFKETFALDAEGAAYVRTPEMHVTIAEKLQAKIKELLEVLVDSEISIEGGDVITIKTSDLKLEVPVTAIGVQGHYLDKRVLYTQEMYDDLKKLSSYLDELVGWLRTHSHPANLQPPRPPFPPSPPELANY